MKTLKINFAQIILLGIAISFFSCEKSKMDDLDTVVLQTVETNAELPSIYINGTLLHSEAFGNSNDPMIIAIHGGPGGDYRSILNLKEFTNEAFYVVFYDQRGSGLSQRHDAEENVFSVELFVSDLDAIINYYGSNDVSQEIYLIGHEWGALIATAYVNQHPEKISGLILNEPEVFSTYISDYKSEINGFIKYTDEHEISDRELMLEMNSNQHGQTIPYWRYGAVCKSEMTKYLEEAPLNIISRINEYTPKVLVCYSDKNGTVNEAQAKQVGEVFNQSEVIKIENCSSCIPHEAWVDYQPKAMEYLNELQN